MKDSRFLNRNLKLRFSCALVILIIIGPPISLSHLSIEMIEGEKIEKDYYEQFEESDWSSSTWFEFINGSIPDTKPEIIPLSSDTTGIMVESTFYGAHLLKIPLEGMIYDLFRLPGGSLLEDVGKPAVPIVSRFIEIPRDVNVSLHIESANYKLHTGFNISPAQEPQVDHPNITASPHFIDYITYSNNTYFPFQPAKIIGAVDNAPMKIRGHRLVQLIFFPIQINPQLNIMRVYSNIKIKIEYSVLSQIDPIDDNLYSQPFEEMLSGMILNYDPLNRPMQSMMPVAPIIPSQGPENVDYLIITHSNLDDITGSYEYDVDTLATWKQMKGLRTKIWTLSPPITSAGIKTQISNAYTTWATAPTYILLVGDTNLIPTNYETFSGREEHHPVGEAFGYIASDVIYTTVDGLDSFSDIFIGRLPVDDLDTLSQVIKKIIDYEQNPVDVPSFYTNVGAVSCFQDEYSLVDSNDDGIDDVAEDGSDGEEDRPFILTSEQIAQFLDQNDYSTERIYCTNPISVWRSHAPEKYFEETEINGYNLIDAAWYTGYSWDYGLNYKWPETVSDTGKEKDIVDCFNSGKFLIFHRDHGVSSNFYNHEEGNFITDRDGWSLPQFIIEDHIGGLENYDNNWPVIFSMDCNTGWFDSETDDDDDIVLSRDVDSLCEELVNLYDPDLGPKGAVATIGSSRMSYSGWNDILLKGFVDAIWDDFDERYASGGLYDLGQIIAYGKLLTAGQGITEYESILLKFSDYPTALDETLELFNLFGDPEMEIWTSLPTPLTITYPDTIGSTYTQSFVVSVTDGITPVNNAKVCLFRDPDILEVRYTDGNGNAYFELAPTSGENIHLTVTKHNYIQPEFNYEIAVSDGGEITIDPVQGPEGTPTKITLKHFDAGTIDITVDGLAPFSTTVTTADTVIDYIIPSGLLEGTINIIAKQGVTKAAVTQYRVLPPGVLPDPFIYSWWVESTWVANPAGSGHDVNPSPDNPDIEIRDYDTGAVIDRYGLEMREKYTIRATIHNLATVDAINTEVTFSIGDYGVGQPGGLWEEIEPSPTDIVSITVPAGSQEYASITWTPLIYGDRCIRATITSCDPADLHLSNNKAQENIKIATATSPVNVTMIVGNPSNETSGPTGTVFLVARQVDSTLPLWRCEIDGLALHSLAPGEYQEITITFEPTDDAEIDDERQFTIYGYLNGDLIGIAEVIVVKGEEEVEPCVWPCIDWELWGPLLLIGGCSIGILVVVIIYKKKR